MRPDALREVGWLVVSALMVFTSASWLMGHLACLRITTPNATIASCRQRLLPEPWGLLRALPLRLCARMFYSRSRAAKQKRNAVNIAQGPGQSHWRRTIELAGIISPPR